MVFSTRPQSCQLQNATSRLKKSKQTSHRIFTVSYNYNTIRSLLFFLRVMLKLAGFSISPHRSGHRAQRARSQSTLKIGPSPDSSSTPADRLLHKSVSKNTEPLFKTRSWVTPTALPEIPQHLCQVKGYSRTTVRPGQNKYTRIRL